MSVSIQALANGPIRHSAIPCSPFCSALLLSSQPPLICRLMPPVVVDDCSRLEHMAPSVCCPRNVVIRVRQSAEIDTGDP
jgi:hypothetical protein